MKVFLSWSGTRSHKVAKLFESWLPFVIQSVKPWVSSEINKGANWLITLNDELKTSATGIVCLTGENKTAPWILFEAGALANGLSKDRVCTFLVDFASGELDPPLSQFQYTIFDKGDIRKLVETLNSQCPQESRVPEGKLATTFEKFWPDFEKDFSAILKSTPEVSRKPEKTDKQYLAEILDTVRNIDRSRSQDSMAIHQHWNASNIPTGSLVYSNIVPNTQGIVKINPEPWAGSVVSAPKSSYSPTPLYVAPDGTLKPVSGVSFTINPPPKFDGEEKK
jgi:hypothetical protein